MLIRLCIRYIYKDNKSIRSDLSKEFYTLPTYKYHNDPNRHSILTILFFYSKDQYKRFYEWFREDRSWFGSKPMKFIITQTRIDRIDPVSEGLIKKI